ncbi:MAG: LysE family transporter [Melioribacteraceae bacterium]|nr:LysE family transporter [Melioribacteraceae bacterium]
MTESFIVILLLGFFAGFFFSVPIAGPISILITSNSLKGRLRYCLRTALGGAIVETLYVFIAIYGLTALYAYYQKGIPIILIAGSFFLLYVGFRILTTKLKLDDLTKKSIESAKYENQGGFRTGLILNFSNPSLFVGWFTSSFLLLSFASSIGLNTGGLDLLLYENVASVEEITGQKIDTLEEYNLIPESSDDQPEKESFSTFVSSLTYAVMVGFGSYIWFYLLSKFLIKYREKLNINWLNLLIKILGIFLVGISLFLIYEGIRMLI